MEQSKLFGAILNSISEGVMTLNKDWRIVSWNSAAEKIIGFHREEVLGRDCSELFRSPICKSNCPVDMALSCGRPYQDVEVAIRTKRNELAHLLVNAAPLYDEDGKVVGGIETFRDVSQSHWMREELKKYYGYTNIVGRSEAMQRVYQRLSPLMESDTTVLIQGESGTGKELIARALHYGGPRRDKSFVAVNCSALPEGVLETELFGHVKGAFTGAIKNRLGKFELANGGTLFLDEIGEISLSTQVKLLRVIEEREFQRIGENSNIKLDIRLITATNKDLYKKVLDGSFRDDLYYRLSVYPLDLPSLRERIDDIPLLTSHFISKFNEQMGASVMGIADKVLDILESYHWPGNVRELANAIEHAFVHRKKSFIYPSDLPYSIAHSCYQGEVQKNLKVRNQVDSLEKDLIVKELESNSWNKSVAAKRLSMSRTTLWRKMKKHGINEPLHI